MQPILLGAACANDTLSKELESLCAKQNAPLFRDDYVEKKSCTSESSNLETKREISAFNPYFCELTAMYWVWKNLDVDYYGLFHYRRILDFTPNTLSAKLKRFFTPRSHIIDKYHLQEHSICSFIQKHKADIFVPKSLRLSPHISSYEDFKRDHYVEDLDRAISYIHKTYPLMRQAIAHSLLEKGAKMYYWNLAIFGKDVFYSYCEWLFDVLFAIMPKSEYKQYNHFQRRVFGFLAERLFNVWLYFHKDKLKVYECDMRFLGSKPSKFFGKVSSKDYERYYFLFIRVYKTKRKERHEY